jgi:hypothetical protein
MMLRYQYTTHLRHPACRRTQLTAVTSMSFRPSSRDDIKLVHHAHLIPQVFPRWPLHEIEQHCGQPNDQCDGPLLRKSQPLPKPAHPDDNGKMYHINRI